MTALQSLAAATARLVEAAERATDPQNPLHWKGRVELASAIARADYLAKKHLDR